MDAENCTNAACATSRTDGATPGGLMSARCTHDTRFSVRSVVVESVFVSPALLFLSHTRLLSLLPTCIAAGDWRASFAASTSWFYIVFALRNFFNLLYLLNLLSLLNVFNSFLALPVPAQDAEKRLGLHFFRIAAEGSCNADDQCNDSLFTHLLPVHEVMFSKC